MSTTRPFSYNTGSPIDGTVQVGNLAIGYPTTGYTGMEWWNGPDEDLGYVIAQPVSGDTQSTPVFSGAPTGEMKCSAVYKGVNINLSNNNQTAFQQFGYQMSVLTNTFIDNDDKVMYSILSTSLEPLTLPQSRFIGVGKTTMNYQGNPYGGYPGNDTQSIGFNAVGEYYYNGSVVSSGLPTWTSNDTIDIAISHGQYWWIRVNGGDWNNNPLGDPATLTGGLTMNSLTNYYPALCPGYEGTMVIQNNATYGVPVGFTLLGTNVTASVGFFRSEDLTNGSFISLTNTIFNQSFTGASDASIWLTANGYWNSYSTLTSPLLSLDAADYSGSGPWIDAIGGKSFTLNNSPTWSSSNGGYFNFSPASSQYAICSTSLPSLSTWSVGVWHYYDGTNSGGSPCIVTETFIGGSLNYSLGNNTGDFSSGFFDGSWRVTDGYSLTTNNWYYIVGTYDGSTIKLYVNNILVDSTNYTGIPTTSGAGIRLMERWDSAEYWGGRLAIVDIFGTSLDQTEITSIWNSTKTRFGFAGPLTIATNSGGGLNGWNPTAFDISPNPAIGTTYPVGSQITFQNGEVRTMVQVDDYSPTYMDIFYDSPISSTTLFPITISY